MSTVRATLTPEPDGTLRLPIPPEFLTLAPGKFLVVATLTPVPMAGSSATNSPKGFGSLAGKICLHADFDAPLEDFRDYAE